MHIQHEPNSKHAIEAYGPNTIQINSQIYDKSLIVSEKEIISSLSITHIHEINSEFIALLTRQNPRVIIIGHSDSGAFLKPEVMSAFASAGIGFEIMDIGAAARTYNVLLGEDREVVAAFILGGAPQAR